MDRVVIRSSPRKYFFLLSLSMLLVAGGVFILLMKGPAVVGWLSIAFFGLGIPIFLSQIVDRRPRIIIDDQGIIDRTLGIGLIPWDEIEGCYVQSVHGNDFICLYLRNPGLYLTKLSRIKRTLVSANEALGFTAFNINLSGVGAKTDEVLELIQKKMRGASNPRERSLGG